MYTKKEALLQVINEGICNDVLKWLDLKGFKLYITSQIYPFDTEVYIKVNVNKNEILIGNVKAFYEAVVLNELKDYLYKKYKAVWNTSYKYLSSYGVLNTYHSFFLSENLTRIYALLILQENLDKGLYDHLIKEE